MTTQTSQLLISHPRFTTIALVLTKTFKFQAQLKFKSAVGMELDKFMKLAMLDFHLLAVLINVL